MLPNQLTASTTLDSRCWLHLMQLNITVTVRLFLTEATHSDYFTGIHQSLPMRAHSGV